jgi:hypothetical protein
MDIMMVMTGFKDPEIERPEFFDMTESSRAAAECNAACRVLPDDDSDTSDSEDDGGVVAVAELPAGALLWPQKVFSDRARTYRRAWHRQMLRKLDPQCKDSHPRIAAGDIMSNIMLWLNIPRYADERRYQMWCLGYGVDFGGASSDSAGIGVAYMAGIAVRLPMQGVVHCPQAKRYVGTASRKLCALPMSEARSLAGTVVRCSFPCAVIAGLAPPDWPTSWPERQIILEKCRS